MVCPGILVQNIDLLYIADLMAERRIPIIL
jgi:hypothetical protein